jgi:hypothetical protein
MQMPKTDIDADTAAQDMLQRPSPYINKFCDRVLCVCALQMKLSPSAWI